MTLESLLRGILGLLLILGIAYAFSNNRKRVSIRLVLGGLGLQILFAVLVLRGDSLAQLWSPLGWPKLSFVVASRVFVKVLNFTFEGAKFVFGNLSISPGFKDSLGFFFAFQVLPTIIFFASLMSVMYYLGIMQKIVQAFAWIMTRLLGTSGAESLSNAANVFVGQTEAPLLIRPFLPDLTRSELLTVMTGGMATIAGGVMAAYVQMLSYSYSELHGLSMNAAQVKFAGQLLGASIMAAPGALIISKILYPETGEPKTRGTVHIPRIKNAANVIDAAASGAADGLKLALNVGAMLIAFIAFIALINFVLGYVGGLTGLNAICIEAFGKPLSLELIFGLVLQFVAYGIGVPWQESFQVGSLVGTKVVLNEFVAYLEMSEMIRNGVLVSEKAITMATFALCGFANFSSIAIQIGGISPLAPNRQTDLSQLGLKAVFGGVLTTLLTATLAGILVGN